MYKHMKRKMQKVKIADCRMKNEEKKSHKKKK